MTRHGNHLKGASAVVDKDRASAKLAELIDADPVSYTHLDVYKRQALVDAYEGLFETKPVVDKWTFSTNGVSIMGRHGIPVVGFGPGKEPEAHAPNEKTWTAHLVKCAAMYAAIPLTYLGQLSK